MAYIGDIIRNLKNEPVPMNEANVLPIMRQADKSIGRGDERLDVVEKMLGGLNVFVSGKMKILLLKIADGTIGTEYVRKNMGMLREINGDRQNLSKVASDNIMKMKSCEDVVSALLGKKIGGSALEIPMNKWEDGDTEEDLERFYARVRDASRKVCKSKGYRTLLDKLDSCHYIEKIYDNNRVVIAKVTSHEGAVGVGAFGASWCTCVAGPNSENMYDRYKDYDIRIVFVDRGDDVHSIWQTSDDYHSYCMNPHDEPDCEGMLSALLEIAHDGKKASEIFDEIDNKKTRDNLEGRFGPIEDMGMLERRYEVVEKTDRFLIVKRDERLGNRQFRGGMNICSAMETDFTKAEWLLSEWMGAVRHAEGEIFIVRNRYGDNIIDLRNGEYVYPDVAADGLTYIGNGIFIVEEREGGNLFEGYNLFDMKKGENIFEEGFEYAEQHRSGLVICEKDDKMNVFDPKRKEFIFPEQVDRVAYIDPDYAIVIDDGGYNMVNMKTKEYMLSGWVNDIVRQGDGYVKAESEDFNYNLFDLEKNEYVLPEWVDEIDRPRGQYVQIWEGRESNLFDLKNNEYILDEWADDVSYPENGIVTAIQDDEEYTVKVYPY